MAIDPIDDDPHRLTGRSRPRVSPGSSVPGREPKPKSRRPVFDPASGEFQDVPIYWRPDLPPGAHIRGPAVIAEDDTSTVVSPSFDARIDRFGYIELTRRET